ncbi:MAG: thiamine pyrophosphate-requiring protein [Abditibacteriales bacterium]|nr:thiamine pyrophosphate-requiring protein [Abditibacteriales bacterium]MDW8365429.1 thiamine pyrophosphate-requiring protein [Abditibacteriales bacterium]
MTGVTAIANILRSEGTEYLFCFPYHPLIDPATVAGIRPILGRMERTVINMADGYTRLSNGRRIGVCCMQYGPGTENAFPGVAQAYADNVPILCLPGGAARSRQGSPPTFEAVPNYRGVTKWAATINAPERIPEMMRRAFTYLRLGRPGPVVVEIPDDVAKATVGDIRYTPVKPVRTAADPQDINEAARLLLNAKSPVLHVGQGVLFADACEELRALAERLQIPVMTTLPGKSAFPENHPLALGSGGYAGTKMVQHFLDKADVVFGIGCSFTRTVFATPIPDGKVLIHATCDERDINKDYDVALALLGDAKLVLQQLLQATSHAQRPPSNVAEEIKAVKAEWLAEWMPRLTSDEVPINPYRVVWELTNTVDKTRTIVTHDAGNPRDQMVPFFESHVPHGYLGWGKSTHLGASLGLAMGAKLAAPEKLVINVMGDGALGMCGMDLETAARERIPILTIVLNNGALGGYEKYMPVATEKYRLKYLSGNYTQVAEGLGVVAERVEKPQDIRPALRRATAVVQSGRPALLEVITREDATFSKYW